MTLATTLFGGVRRPEEPPLVRGPLPWLGCGLAFGRDAGAFLADCRRRHGDVFTLLIAGRRMTFVLDPHDVPWVLKEQDALGFAPIAEEMSARAFGHTRAGHRVVGGMHEFYPPHLKTATLGPLAARNHEELEALLASDERATGGGWRHGRLHDWVYRLIFGAGVAALFGETGRDPTLQARFRALDEKFPLLVAGVPARLLGIDRLRRGLGRALERLAPDASGIIRDRQHHIEPRVGARETGHMQLAMLWASQANTVPAAFWSLAHLLADPEARRAVETEVRSTAPPYLPERLRAMPLLQSSIHEALRLTSGSLTLRDVARDFTLELDGGRSVTLRRGDRVCLYPYLSHRDPALFDQPERYRFDRFTDDNGRPRQFFLRGRKVQMPLMPYGGGESMCPGRFLAHFEVMQLVALSLQRFDIELLAPLPALDQRRAGLGILPPRHDVPFRYRARASLRETLSSR